MIDKRIIEQVIQEQKLELQAYAEEEYCTRREETLVDVDSKRAQVVVGVRRSGKSVLCYHILQQHKDKFAYVNFDDERFANLKADELNNVLEVLYKVYGNFKYLFMDEAQNIDGWHLFVNRLLRQRMHILITGSNAKLLSGELATHLTGRNDQIELLPLSFSEFCDCKKIDKTSITTQSVAFRRAAYDEYITQGGFPELLTEKNKRRYVTRLVEEIIDKDLIHRFKIKNERTFKQLANHLMNVAPVILNLKELGEQFDISTATAGNYVDHIKQAYLLVSLQKYSVKSKQRVRNEKIYPVDVALMDGRENAMVGENLGWRLETQVFLELLRRNLPLGRDIFYYKERNGVEADFVVCQGNHVQEIYQVSYDISNEKTLKRELRGLLAASSATNCDNLYLITDNAQTTIEKDGKNIEVIPAYEWLVKW
ncbi:MAG: ATP-binding protein [Prevotella sp.]|jgi:predicted AAA+ superfamily ATPase